VSLSSVALVFLVAAAALYRPLFAQATLYRPLFAQATKFGCPVE
jgi:hypothetical protein